MIKCPHCKEERKVSHFGLGEFKPGSEFWVACLFCDGEFIVQVFEDRVNVFPVTD